MLFRELRALFSSSSAWLALAVAGPAAGLAYRHASEAIVDANNAALAHTAIAASTIASLAWIAALAFPFVVAHAFAADRQNGTSRIVLALGHRASTSTLAKAVACALAFAMLALPALTVVAAFALAGGHVHIASLGCALFGVALCGALVCGLGAAAASLTKSPAACALVVVAAAVLSTEAARSSSKLAASSPSTWLATFSLGVLDARAAIVATIVALALLAVAAGSSSPALAIEKKLTRAVVVVVVAAGVSFAAWQVRASFDVSEGRRNSFPRAIEEAFAKIGDPIHVAVRLRGDDPHFTELQRDVLGPMSRVAVVDVERLDSDARRYGLSTFQIGTRASDTRGVRPEEIVPQVFDLAGVKAPVFVADMPPKSPPPPSTSPIALVLAFVAWPALGMAQAWRLRRRRGA